MENEIYIIIIGFIWALAATAMCVYLVMKNEDKDFENEKLRADLEYSEKYKKAYLKTLYTVDGDDTTVKQNI